MREAKIIKLAEQKIPSCSKAQCWITRFFSWTKGRSRWKTSIGICEYDPFWSHFTLIYKTWLLIRMLNLRLTHRWNSMTWTVRLKLSRLNFSEAFKFLQYVMANCCSYNHHILRITQTEDVKTAEGEIILYQCIFREWVKIVFIANSFI